ncbi:MAG: von Willebrand factor type A domain-containing protein [Myxococcota bacterium]|nr:von Willebrand factor type A domain-containing protein [Myxococcota bacterium]
MRLTLVRALPLVLLAAGCADHGAPHHYSRSGSDAGAAMGAPWGAPPAAPDEPEPGDRYEGVGTNPFVYADHDPFSTFAADVDTASYDIFVRDATDGRLPHPDSVRLEEYVNAFDYDYPAPAFDDEVPFAIDLSGGEHPFRPGIMQLRVGIQASTPPEFVQLPTHLVFLVDVSGSMSASDKLPLARQVMLSSLEQLRANDTVSIVSYAGETSVRLPPTRVSDRAAIEGVVDRLTAGGGTAGGPGIQLAYEQAEAGFIEGGFNHVVLMTDGDFNIGISDTTDLVSLIEEKRQTGVTLTALGFGRGNLNDAMMEAVSNAGNGVYSVITSREHAMRYGAEDILHTAHFVAQDMKLQVEFNPDHVLAYRLLGYENRAIADDDFTNDIVDAGEVGAGLRVTALYEVVLADQSVPMPDGAPEVTAGEPIEGERVVEPHELVRVRVRWKDLGAAEEDPAYETWAAITPEELAGPVEDDDFLWASSMAALAEILKGNAYGDPEHLAGIQSVVRAQAALSDERAALVRHLDRVSAMIAP